MSRNLTNLQLGVITSRIMSALRAKKITDDVKKSVTDKVNKEYKREKAEQYFKKYSEAYERLQEADRNMTEFRNRLNECLGVNSFINMQDLNSLNKWYNNKIEFELNKLLPSEYEIQGDIVLASVQGSKDIIDDILKKY